MASQQQSDQIQPQNDHLSPAFIFRPWESTEPKDVSQPLYLNHRSGCPTTPIILSAFVPFNSDPSSAGYYPSSAFPLPSYWTSPYSLLFVGRAPPSKTVESESGGDLSTSNQSSRLISSTIATPFPVHHPRRVGRRLFAPEIITKLNTWFRSHVQHPYPLEEDLDLLSVDCGGDLSKRQIRKWISNRRDRTRNTRPYNHCPHPKSVKSQRRLMDGPAAGESGATSSASSTETDSGFTSEVESTIDSSNCDTI